MMQMNKKLLLILSFTIFSAPIQLISAKVSTGQKVQQVLDDATDAIDSLLGVIALTALFFKYNPKAKARFIDLLEKLRIMKYVDKIPLDTDDLIKIGSGDIRGVLLDKAAEFAHEKGITITGFNREDLERIAKGDIKGFSEQKLKELKKGLIEHIQKRVGITHDDLLRASQPPGITSELAEKFAKLIDGDPVEIATKLKGAVVTKEEFLGLAKKVGHQWKNQLVEKLGEAALKLNQAPEAAVAETIPVDIEFDEDEIDLEMPEDFALKFTATEKFFKNYEAIYKQKGRSGFKEILKDYKNKWLEENPHIPKKQTARKFLEDMSKVMTKEVADIHGEYGAKLDNMTVDSLLSKRFGRESFAARELQKGMEPIFER